MRDSREEWDAAAAAFDEEADHGLRDPECRAAWERLLVGDLPSSPSRVADLGCGTGSLSRLLADLGHRVTGLDFSPVMVRLARAKVPEAVVLVEGGWQTGAGLDADETVRVVRRVREEALVQPLPDPALWGGPVRDERYLVLSRS